MAERSQTHHSLTYLSAHVLINHPRTRSTGADRPDPFTHALTQSLTGPINQPESTAHLPTRSLTHALTHPPNQSIRADRPLYSFTHSLTHSLRHSLDCKCSYCVEHVIETVECETCCKLSSRALTFVSTLRWPPRQSMRHWCSKHPYRVCGTRG